MHFFPRKALVLFVLAWPLSHASAQVLACQPCNDHYGRVTIGKSVQRMMVLTNSGTKSLRIKAKSISGAAFAFGNFPLPVDLGAGKSIKLPVIFAPSVKGKNTGTITLNSNAQNPKLAIDVVGVGVQADQAHLTIAPASLDFGSVTVGTSARLTITLSATVAPVTVSTIDSSSSEFTLPGLTLPLTVNVGTNVAVTVKFTPKSSGTASANLTLNSNADNSPGTVGLTGVGVVTGSHSADLTWDPSPDPVVGYNVYRGSQRGGPYSLVNSDLDASTFYTDSTVKGGTTYFYVVKAVNAENQESAPSNEAKVVIPSP